MPRLTNWRAQEVMETIGMASEENANSIMDDVVERAKALCPVGLVSRPGKWSAPGVVSFSPKKGRNRGQSISFATGAVWTGRTPGDLRSTIRRVNREGSGSVRVYAGTRRIAWALLVEKGSHNYKAHPFLRPAFQAIKAQILRRIKGDGEPASRPVGYRIGIDPKTGLVSYID